MALLIVSELAPKIDRHSSQHTLPEASVVRRELSMPLSDTSIRREPCRQTALIGTTMSPDSSRGRRHLRGATPRTHRTTSEHGTVAGGSPRIFAGAFHNSYEDFEASLAHESVQRGHDAEKLAAAKSF